MVEAEDSWCSWIYRGRVEGRVDTSERGCGYLFSGISDSSLGHCREYVLVLFGECSLSIFVFMRLCESRGVAPDEAHPLILRSGHAGGWFVATRFDGFLYRI